MAHIASRSRQSRSDSVLVARRFNARLPNARTYSGRVTTR